MLIAGVRKSGQILIIQVSKVGNILLPVICLVRAAKPKNTTLCIEQ